MGLETYHAKRDFRQTPEPKGRISKPNKHRFVCQEHHASSLHFDFRLEAGGVLHSWSIRKGPSMNPAVRRLAVPTEDHPVEYLKFQGDIPEGNYGAGQHRIWDEGEYRLIDGSDADKAIRSGKVKLELRGKKVKGTFNFFRLGSRDHWLLVKSKDEHAEENWKLELLIPDKEGDKFIIDDDKSPRRSGPRRTAKPSPNAEVIKKNARPRRSEKLPSIGGLMRSPSLEGDKRVEVEGFALDLTSLDRIYWPDEGFTKGDLLRYYYKIAKYILPYLKDRPLIMKRYPTGVKGTSFHQHDVDEVPEFVRTRALDAEDKGTHEVDYVVCDNLATHLYLANLGAIERHPWHSRTDKIDDPDWFVFDLDPGDGVKFETICDLALIARDVLADLELNTFVKTSGSRGIHIYVPIERVYSFEDVADAAAKIAAAIAKKAPSIATVARSKSGRKKGQIYVDHLQNAYGKSVVAPYSVRPKPGATVSMPLEWKEVEERRISISDYTIENALERIRSKGDLFSPVLKGGQRLERAIETLGLTKRK